MKTWDDVKEELAFSEEDKVLISMEEDLIRTMIANRKNKELTQAELGH